MSYVGSSSPGPASPPKLASVVARRIEDDVLDRALPVGAVVGSEAELLDRFGVSRAVLREAVRIVEHGGLARMRRGPGGGLVVAEPRRSAVATAISVWFSFVGVTIDEILEAKVPLSTGACRLAAERIGESGIERLRSRLAELEARSSLRPSDVTGLDRLIAGLSRNRAVALFADALGDIGLSRVAMPRADGDAADQLAGYRGVVDAIVAGDAGAAQARMRAVLDTTRARVQDRPQRVPRASTEPDGDGGKLGERVAAALRDDIEAARWPVGEILGSEAELIGRYGVSRAVLREAVRILEHHGALRTKRGPGGGLVVAEPDGAAVVRSAQIALEFGGVASSDLFEARDILEVATVALAAERCTPETAETLQRGLEAERAGKNAAVTFHDLHHMIAEAAGNRPLMLFIDVLAAITLSHVRPARRTAEAVAAISDDANRAHASILAAVTAGDASLARRRMARHLDAASVALS
ncbi:MAG TPA: FCD domain-containing protein [Acidimicrobiales bacterium]|jgi:DNA-binding FadR family transcriptional regulator|nr:FCD domain-containing protein [Acidimicrobiales bacterium]